MVDSLNNNNNVVDVNVVPERTLRELAEYNANNNSPLCIVFPAVGANFKINSGFFSNNLCLMVIQVILLTSVLSSMKGNRLIAVGNFLGPPRKEMDSARSTYDQLSEDVLQASGSGTEPDRIKTRSEERFPLPGEPTDDDVCSIDCKAEILQQRQALPPKDPVGTRALSSSTHRLDTSPGLTESEQDAWEYEKYKWSKKISSLCTYHCISSLSEDVENAVCLGVFSSLVMQKIQLLI
ncbi:hypothetical protein AKJ16_DCAP04169 [Drosera capensis]